jgi:hypothetical protein
MHIKKFFLQKNWIKKTVLIFFTATPVILGKLFSGAFFHLGMFIFLKSAQKDGFFHTRHDPF